MGIVTIEKITGIYPIEGADRISKAYIYGSFDPYVIRTKDFKEGDYCLCVKSKAIITNKRIKCFRFLKRYNFIVKPRTFFGVKSYGILLPLNSKGLPSWIRSGNFLGVNLSKSLGIKRYTIIKQFIDFCKRFI